MRTARECAFNAGLSASALPVAFRIKVLAKNKSMKRTEKFRDLIEGRTHLGIFVINTAQGASVKQELIEGASVHSIRISRYGRFLG